MNSIVKKTGLVIPFATLYFFAEAQIYTSRFEAGINGGVFIYQGDLTPEPLGAYATLKPQFGIFAAYLLNRSFSVRGNFSFGGLKADDAKYNIPEYRKQRAFRFTTPVSEFSGMLVWDILGKNGIEGRRGFAPYLFTGVGVSLLNIQRDWSNYNAAYFNAESVSEGLVADMAHPVPKMLPVVPVGAGIKYFISGRLAIKAETNYRLMSSDYLDGFSQSVNPGKKDNYYSHSVGIVLSLGYKDRNDCPVKP
ncbi:MAG: hypothetical protein KF862_14110 [Chitinophagaceae bacterium]|nr:hypothetical protein [Chitinophagaceae bacterium]